MPSHIFSSFLLLDSGRSGLAGRGGGRRRRPGRRLVRVHRYARRGMERRKGKLGEAPLRQGLVEHRAEFFAAHEIHAKI